MSSGLTEYPGDDLPPDLPLGTQDRRTLEQMARRQADLARLRRSAEALRDAATIATGLLRDALVDYASVAGQPAPLRAPQASGAREPSWAPRLAEVRARYMGHGYPSSADSPLDADVGWLLDLVDHLRAGRG